jgi:hypothetical protein
MVKMGHQTVRTRLLICWIAALATTSGCKNFAVGTTVDAGDGTDAASGSGGRYSATGGRTGSAGGTAGTAGTGGNLVSGGTAGSHSTNDGGAATRDASVDGALPVRPLGGACSNRFDCASANCVDGVCCDTACSDSCVACNLVGLEGHCSPVATGSTPPSPHPACPIMAATTCKQNGVCDGKGACQTYPSGTVCGAGTCTASTQMSVVGSTCDGLGTCKPAPAVACAPFKCKADGTACAEECTVDADCQGQPCVAGSCGKVANGSKCSAGNQCISGNCVDGYCCDVACAGSCQACDLSGSIGKCVPLAANQAPHGGRMACASGTCGSHCDGKSASCVFAPSTTLCGSAKCTNGMATAAVNCDGMGSCPNASVTSCGGLVCSGTTCKTSCATDADCLAPTPYCSAGKCQSTKPLGRTCGGGSECATGNCVNGVCCSASSCAACQACNLATPGTCSNKAANAADTACGSATNCRTGTCNGAGACNEAADGTECGTTNKFCKSGVCGSCMPNQSCTPANSPCKNGMTSCATGTMACAATGNKSAGTSCGPAASCSGTTLTHATVCDGNGACAPPATQSCPNGCNGSKTDCLSCQSGLTACNGTCVDTTSNAAHCGAGCAACGSTAPICLNSACVQCASDASCSGSTPSCDPSSHKCVCQRQSKENLLINGGFDTAAEVVGTWIDSDPALGQAWTSADSDGCQGSGAVFGAIYATSNCVQITPGVTYYFGLKYKNPLSDPALSCTLKAFGGSSCSPTDTVYANSPMLMLSATSSWTKASSSWVMPTGLTSADVFCSGDYSIGGAYIDQVYLNATANSF